MKRMATIHITDADLARDVRGVLAKLGQGVEIVVELDHQEIAVLKPVGNGKSRRSVDECIALAKAYEESAGEAPLPDSEFAADVQAGIEGRRDSLNPPSWD